MVNGSRKQRFDAVRGSEVYCHREDLATRFFGDLGSSLLQRLDISTTHHDLCTLAGETLCASPAKALATSTNDSDFPYKSQFHRQLLWFRIRVNHNVGTPGQQRGGPR